MSSAIEEIASSKSSSRGKRRMKTYENEDTQFKSPNLQAERRRRARIGASLLHLRSLVPNITNMTKEAILEDAITYIEDLETEEKRLRNELLQIEASDPQEETNDFGADSAFDYSSIEPEVKVIRMGVNRLWMKVIFAKKPIGKLTRILEAIDGVGYEMNETSFSSMRGAAALSCCLEEVFGVFQSEEKFRMMLLGIIS